MGVRKGDEGREEKPQRKKRGPYGQDEGGLTWRERLFVSYYLGEAKGNGTKAATLAGYQNPAVTASNFIRKPNIRAALDAHLAEVAMSANEVLARLSEIASASLGDFIDVNRGGYRINLVKAKRRGKTHLLKELKPSEHGVGIKLHDSIAALELLAKYHGLFLPIDLSNAPDEIVSERAGRSVAGGTQETRESTE